MGVSTKVVLIISSLLTFLTSNIFSQAPDTLWTKTYGRSNCGDVGYSVQQTIDGGYIITGYTESVDSTCPYRAVWLLKTDASGDTIWTRTFGGTHQDAGYSVQQILDGGYIVVGRKYIYSTNAYHVYLIKTDASGETLWTKTFGSSGKAIGYSVQQTSDSGYIITGTTIITSSSYYDVYLIKTNSSGDALWTKILDRSIGDVGYSVQQTTDGGYIISGVTYSNGYEDIWLIKTDAIGDTLWTRKFGESNASDRGRSVRQTSDGGYIIAGSINLSNIPEVFLVKTNAIGQTIWTKSFGGGIVRCEGYSVQQTSDGGYIVVGKKRSTGAVDLWLLKTDGSGDTLWTKTLGGFGAGWGWGHSVNLTTDGGYIITGVSSDDVWLIKTASGVTTVKQNTDLTSLDFFFVQNYPNPFNPTTTIKYQIPELSFVTIKVYDVLGNEVATLLNEENPSGTYEIEFDGTELPSGVYFYQLKAGNFVETKKMLLLK